MFIMHRTLIWPIAVVLVLYVGDSSPQADVWHNNQTGLCHLDSCSKAELSNSSQVVQSCETANNSTLLGHCCITQNHHYIIGLDLTSCNITNFDVFDQHEGPAAVYSKSALQILLLEDNPLGNCSEDAFSGMSGLHYLNLPEECSCPGGADAWQREHSDKNGTQCSNMTNICVSQNVSCPLNSHCEMGGPGVTLCLCDPGYSGYKCLTQGSFPYIPFISGIIGSTVFLSAFLWLTQRRKVKKRE